MHIYHSIFYGTDTNYNFVHVSCLLYTNLGSSHKKWTEISQKSFSEIKKWHDFRKKLSNTNTFISGKNTHKQSVHTNRYKKHSF